MEQNEVWDHLDLDASQYTGWTVPAGPSCVSAFDITHEGCPWFLRRTPVRAPSDSSSASPSWCCWGVAQTRVDTFVCPDDQPYTKDSDPSICIIFFAQNGLQLGGMLQDPPLTPTYGRTDYVGVAGYFGYTAQPPPVVYPNPDFSRGVFWNRSKVDFRDITRGASHTLLFGEVTAGPSNSFSWCGVGAMAAAWGLSDTDGWWKFGSYHPGLVSFCLADGSVTKLSTEIDLATFQHVLTIADGSKSQIP